jgi:hypothetical protein
MTDGINTDWLANCYQGYGFGYTKEQALLAMAGHADQTECPVTVSLVEHKGNATVRMTGWEVEEYVDGEQVEIPSDEFNRLVDAALEAEIAADAALGESETVVDSFE